MGTSAGPHRFENAQPLDGGVLYAMLASGLECLEQRVDKINRLNVFPVPDRDTGTNMFSTLKLTLATVDQTQDHSVGHVAALIAERALFSARGNSGVLLAEFLRGFARTIAEEERLNAPQFVAAMREGAGAARAAVSKPVEGTVLTVMHDAAEASALHGRAGDVGLPALLEVAVNAATTSLEKTPQLLPLLRQAGVVDAGAAGFLAILEGMLSYLNDHSDGRAATPAPAPPGSGRREPSPLPAAAGASASTAPFDGKPAAKSQTFGYCTEFLMRGRNLDESRVRSELNLLGESLLLIGTQETLRVHIHARDPGRVLSQCLLHGSLSDVSIRNMDEQAGQVDRSLGNQSELSQGNIGVVAVADGTGFAEIFRSLGAEVILAIDRTRGPDREQLLDLVQALPWSDVVILANDPVVSATVESIRPLTVKRLSIVEAGTTPAAVAGLVEWDDQRPLEESLQKMRSAAAGVHTAEIDRSGNEYIASLDGKGIGANQDIEPLLDSVLAATGEAVELATVYYARGAAKRLLDGLTRAARSEIGGVRLEVHYGGQPAPLFLISLE